VGRPWPRKKGKKVEDRRKEKRRTEAHRMHVVLPTVKKGKESTDKNWGGKVPKKKKKEGGLSACQSLFSPKRAGTGERGFYGLREGRASGGGNLVRANSSRPFMGGEGRKSSLKALELNHLSEGNDAQRCISPGKKGGSNQTGERESPTSKFLSPRTGVETRSSNDRIPKRVQFSF